MSNITPGPLLKLILSKGILGATDNLQDATRNEVVFYKLNENEKTKKLFEERLEKSQSCLVVINKKISSHYSNKEILVASEDEFLECQKIVCDQVYPLKKNLKLVAITGTNGKTTTTHLSVVLADKFHCKALGIGTLGLTKASGAIACEFSTTTPSYLQLRRILAKFQDEIDVIFMEVSSHALEQERVYKIQFDCGVWTNFTQDHLDYHLTIEDYFKSKCLLITKHLKLNAPFFIPTDQSELKRKIEETIMTKKEISLARKTPENWSLNRPIFFQNSYNMANLELAFSLNFYLLNKSEDEFAKINLETLSAPEGRFYTITNKDQLIVIDYAHTPDAILNVAGSVAQNFSGRPLSILFGCGGNRDKSKRPKMAEAALLYSKKIYITSDNPRFEDPKEIINDVVAKKNPKQFIVEVDRKVAILQALERMDSNEILLILGKGHEKYQEINGTKTYFSDFDIVRDFFKSKGQL